MRSTTSVLFGVVFGGCAAAGGGSHGVTYQHHAGTTEVVFTNASPEKMCALHMSFEDERDYGDNWLTAGGLPSGKSIEFKVRPGKYKATWNTCKTSDTKPYYAGTATGELAIDVQQQTQLFAYTAGAVVPTKRAAALGRPYLVVRFPGQAIQTIAHTTPAKVDAFAAAEAELGSRRRVPVQATSEQPPVEEFDARAVIDPTAKPSKKGRVRPTLDRKHDVAAAGIKYRAR